MSSSEYEYVALIDESGEPGLRKVRPLDPDGSSEWLIISAAVFRRTREDEAKVWAQELQAACGNRHAKQIHFADLPPEKQKAACKQMAGYPMRCFVVASNKKNMKGHHNPFAERVSESLLGRLPNYRWLYYWVSRVLLEKVTDFVAWHSEKEFGSPKKVRIIFSVRGGIRYDELGAYYDVLRAHDFAETQHLTYDQITWSVMDRDLLEAYPDNSRVELSLPDIGASAFFAACDKRERKGKIVFPAPAKFLKPIMGRRPGRSRSAGYGVKLMPDWKTADLDPDQSEIFKFYGYRFGK